VGVAVGVLHYGWAMWICSEWMPKLGVVAPRKLDYGNFDLQWLARFPGYTLAHNPLKERS
jgi:hypothetical protein